MAHSKAAHPPAEVPGCRYQSGLRVTGHARMHTHTHKHTRTRHTHTCTTQTFYKKKASLSPSSMAAVAQGSILRPPTSPWQQCIVAVQCRLIYNTPMCFYMHATHSQWCLHARVCFNTHVRLHDCSPYQDHTHVHCACSQNLHRWCSPAWVGRSASCFHPGRWPGSLSYSDCCCPISFWSLNVHAQSSNVCA
jgi:hypothetical protein